MKTRKGLISFNRFGPDLARRLLDLKKRPASGCPQSKSEASREMQRFGRSLKWTFPRVLGVFIQSCLETRANGYKLEAEHPIYAKMASA
ncbi:MAG: hypothetical protein ACOVS5_17330 [Oligoflexus sp.]